MLFSLLLTKHRTIFLALRSIYRMTRTSNAVVCGGMLAVINAAWRTLTRNPGTNPEKFIGLPKPFMICALSATLNRTTEDRFASLTVVKLLFCLSISTILPTVTLLLFCGLLTTCITYAADWGGMLLVVAFENAAFTVIPGLKSVIGILLLFSSIITVFPLTLSRIT